MLDEAELDVELTGAVSDVYVELDELTGAVHDEKGEVELETGAVPDEAP